MTLLKTNIPGFMKDPKTGVLHNVNEAAILANNEAYRRWKENRGLKVQIEDLEDRIRRLETLIK